MSLTHHSRKSTLICLFAGFLLTVVNMTALVTETLENGLQIIVKENHTAPIAALRIYVKTGSIYEQEYLGTGISHYFEHLINGGTTTTRTEKEIKQLIDQLGGVNNAYTTKDHTCYYITTSSEMIGSAVELMADWMSNSSFPENEVKREKGVVLEELKKGKEEPLRIIDKLLYETMFTKHPVRYPTIGYKNLIQSVTREDIIKYYKRMYVPSNMVVVATGDINEKEVFQHIRKAFNNLKRHSNPAISLPKEPAQLGKREKTIIKPGLGEAYLNIAFRTVTIQNQDLFPLDVLSYILSRGRSSRLVKLLREEQRLVSSIYTYSYTPNYDAGVFVASARCKNDNIDSVINTFLKEIKDIQEKSVAEMEVTTAIKQMVAEDILSKQTAVDEASELGINMITTGNPEFNSVYLDGIRNVKAEDIQRVAQTYFHEKNMSLVMLRPEESVTESSQSLKGSNSKPIEFFQLDNGLRLLIKSNPNTPLVNLQALFLGGALYEEQNQAGICGITAEMLTRGNETMTRDEISKVIDGIGGKFSSSSGNNTFGLNVEVLKEDFSTALGILAESIQKPSFPESEFETTKINTLSAIQSRDDRWDSELAYLFRQQYFKNHPYRNDSLGTKETVEQLSVKSIQHFYQEFVVPKRGIITIFGDIDPEEAKRAVFEAFKNFDRTSNPLPSIQPIELPSQNQEVIETVKKNLAAVYIGYPGIRITNSEDRFPLLILDTILSGFNYPSGWLHESLRGGEQDYVYLVHAFNFIGVEPGYFGIMAASSPEKMDKVIEIIHENVKKIRTERVSEEELANAKIICNTAEKLSHQTNADMALLAAIDELYGLGYDFEQQYTEKINAVTADEVQRVAEKYFTKYLLVRTKPEPSESNPTIR